MTTNKKLVVTVGVMAVALILALTGIIVVLVTANQRASSAVNVKYTASDVAVTLSATAYLGSNSHAFTKGGVVGGETELVLSPTVTEGSLSQTSDIASFDLSKTNDYVVFEYVFANNTDTIDVRIDQDGIPATKENINLTYTYSDTQITNFNDLEDNAEFTAQLLPAYKGEETVKYVYIKAQIADLLYDSSLVGDFGWALSKPHEADVNTVTLSVANSAYIERESTNMSSTEVTSDYTYRTLDSEIDVVDIGVYPAEVNKAFVGWSETEGGTAISTISLVNNDTTHNALRATSAKTLYPVYKDGNVPENHYGTDYENKGGIDSSGLGLYLIGWIPDTITDLVIPDIASAPFSMDPSIIITSKIMKIECSTSLFSNNASVESVYMGRYIEEIVLNSGSVGLFDGCSNLKSIELPSKMTTIPENFFKGCTGLETFVIPDQVNSLGIGVFRNCTGLKSVDLGNLTGIGDYCFEGCTGLETFTIPDYVTSIGYSSFYGCTNLKNIEFNNKLSDIDNYAFANCSSIERLDFPESLTVIYEEAFIGCTSLHTISGLIMPNGISGHFVDCPLTSVSFSKRCTGLSPRMFEGCTTLKTITIPKNIVSIFAHSFGDCSNFETIIFEDPNGWMFDGSPIDLSDPVANVQRFANIYQNYDTYAEITKR